MELADAFKFYKGSFTINGIDYQSFEDARQALVDCDNISDIIMHNTTETRARQRLAAPGTKPEYSVLVKSYMTKKSAPGFDFMAKWNNDNPMPLVFMVGTVEKETAGMIYMKLHGDIVADMPDFCMKCGKAITNPVSRYFHIGPVCGEHNYVNPFATTEELNAEIEKYKTTVIQKIVWEGWIIKSAIIKKEAIK